MKKEYICIKDDLGFKKGTIVFQIKDLDSSKHRYTHDKFCPITIDSGLIENSPNWKETTYNNIYVVYNINHDIIGIADSPDRAVGIYLERYGETDWESAAYFEDDEMIIVFKSEYDYLKYHNKIEEYGLNEFYYR